MVQFLKWDEGVIQGLHKIRSSAREMANGLQQDRRDLVVSSLRESARESI